MLRDPQHERKITKDANSNPFVLSLVEGFREGFSLTARRDHYAREVLSHNKVEI